MCRNNPPSTLSGARMSFMNKSPQRVWNFHPASFRLRAISFGFRKLVVGGPKPVRMLLISDGAAHTSEQQFAPIDRHASLLRDRLGVVAQYRKLADALLMDSRALAGFDLVGLKLVFQTPAPEAERIAQHFAKALAGTGAKLVYFDGDDDSNIQYHGVISAVDLYVKKHMFADDQAYLRRYLGKSNLTDHVAREHGASFADDIIPTSGGLDRAELGKLHLGWNIALDDKIFDLSRHIGGVAKPARDIDISCRAYVQPSVWTHALRSGVLERMEAMSGRFNILAPRDRVSQEKYYEEMLRSRICVSPFGFGEICWRDFEAILCGCLLVKPDMGHVKTLPDLFVPGVTYVPVRWDYSDLETQCAHYLGNESERLRIVERASQALLASLEPEWFLDSFARLLTRLSLAAPAEASRLSNI
ncbi:MAG TPA: glycosyltransferase [Rhizobacter sp.]|nr:glycosyltransferase [Rhizobacter sp.]